MPLSEDDRRWILEQLERVETSLPTEFHERASAVEARRRSHSATMRAFEAELEVMDDPAKKLERLT
jgi:hypothetical protein